MKTKNAFLVLIAMMAPPVMRAADLYVFAGTNGVVTCAPRPLPSVASTLAERKPVLGLHGATDAERAACGWYRVEAWNGALASNEYVSARSYKVNAKAGTATESVVIAVREPRVKPSLRARIDKMLDGMDPKLSEDERVIELLRALAEVTDERDAR